MVSISVLELFDIEMPIMTSSSTGQKGDSAALRGHYTHPNDE